MAVAIVGLPLAAAAQTGVAPAPHSPDPAPAAAPAAAPSPSRLSGFVPLGFPGSAVDDDARLLQLEGRAATHGWMMRTSSRVVPLDSLWESGASYPRRCAPRWAPIAPELDAVWSSDIPVERNDGPRWSGRGLSTRIVGGIRLSCGAVRLQLAPELWYAANRDFPLVGVTVTGMSGYSNPFFSGTGWSADTPLRFGNRSLLAFDLGQTSLEADAGPVTLALSSEGEWWGPGIRNALVLSTHAAGVPRFYVRTREPVRTAAGLLEAKWMVGALVESPYFDVDPANDLRSLSGLVVSFAPAVDTSLTLGIARVVFAPVPGAGALPARFLDAVARWGEGANVRLATEGRAADQLTTLFGRWVFPRNRVEVYGEWARVIVPASATTFFTIPYFSQGYTLGLQWLSADRSAASAWRVQAEATNLEQPTPTRDALPPSFYVSPTVAQGYTHRGQVLGAMIGPGSSAQWAALDRFWMRGTRQAGFFLSRVRWANDAFYRAPTGLSVWAHDVSLVGGMRGAWLHHSVRLSGEILVERRLNYLFQSATVGFIEDDTFDVNNLSLRLVVAPGAVQRAR